MAILHDRVNGAKGAESQVGETVPYILKSNGNTMLGLGQNAILPDGPLATLAERTPADVANAVLFLLSEKAGHITMADLYVDGGATLRG